jgi:Cu/Zn superoxide dismutase
MIQVSKGEIVARYRKTAIAAVASALLLTATAAYANDLNLSNVVRSTTSSVSWAYYSGGLTDFTTAPEVVNPDVFKGAKATAMMITVGEGSYFRVRIYGLQKSAIGNSYGAHLHEKPCVPGDGSAAGPHYNITPYDLVAKVFDVVSDQTEVWLDSKVNSEGNARTTANVPFVPKPGERSIVFHAQPTVHHHTDGGPLVGSAGPRLACLPLKIKSFTS